MNTNVHVRICGMNSRRSGDQLDRFDCYNSIDERLIEGCREVPTHRPRQVYAIGNLHGNTARHLHALHRGGHQPSPSI